MEVFELYGKLEFTTRETEKSLRGIDNVAKQTGKSLENLENKAKAAGKGTDAAMSKALADIKRYQNENLKAEKELTRQFEREAKARANIQIREAKRANDAAIKELKAGQSGGGIGALGAAGPIGLALAAGGVIITKAIEYSQIAINKTIEADRANRLLAASATEAGKSYAFLADKNQKFAEVLGLSNVAAATTTAKITQLAAFSGDTSEKNIDRLLKSFADLAAARGISSRDLETLVGSILSGQDEGLNRLGIADPGKLYEAYAKSIGTTSDKLTQFQKVQAATNAVVDKAGLFTGAADAKMKSLEGSVDRTAAAWDNFTTSISKFATQGTFVNNILLTTADILKSLTPDVDGLRKKSSEGTLKSSDIDAAGAPSALRRYYTKGLGAIGLISSATPGGLLFNHLTGGKLYENSNIAFHSDISAGIQRDQLQQQINAQILADAQQRKSAEDAERQLRQKIADDALKNNQNELVSIVKAQQSAQSAITESYYKREELKLRSHLDLTKQDQLKTIRAVAGLREESLKRQIQSTEDNFQVLRSTQGLSAAEEIKLRTATNAELIKLQDELINNQIQAQQQIAAKEREIYEERKRLLEDFNNYRESSQTGLIKNPFQRIAAEGRISANEAFNRFKDLGGNYSNQAASLENQKTQVRLQDELKNQLDTVRSLAYGASQNPYVQLFAQAKDAIDKARESTQFLGKDIQNAVMKAAQANNLNSLFNLRADTALSALSYRQKAEQILNPNRAVDEAQIIREQIYALQNANISEDVRNRRLADIFMSSDPRNFPNEYRGFAYESLNKEAQRRIDEEKAGEKLFALFEKNFTALGLKVNLQGQANAEIEIKDKRISVTQAPNMGDTARDMGLLSNGYQTGSFISGGDFSNF